MNNELEILNTILEKITTIESATLVSTNVLLYFLGGIVAVGTSYLLYKAVSNFISF